MSTFVTKAKRGSSFEGNQSEVDKVVEVVRAAVKVTAKDLSRDNKVNLNKASLKVSLSASLKASGRRSSLGPGMPGADDDEVGGRWPVVWGKATGGRRTWHDAVVALGAEGGRGRHARRRRGRVGSGGGGHGGNTVRTQW